jgi:branched-chain amino acid transport system substrate-binding protein
MDQGSNAVPGLTEGAKAAVAYINKSLGGIAGHSIKLDYCSVGTDAQTNQQCGQHFANSNDALVVTGIIFNGGPMYSAMKASGVPLVGLVPLTAADFSSQVWYWTAGQQIQGGMVNLALDADPNAKTLGVLNENNAVGQAALQLMKASAGNKVKLVNQYVDPTAADLSGPATALGKVDVYVVNLQGTGCVQGAKAVEAIDPQAPVVSQQECADSRTSANMKNWYIANINKYADLGGTTTDADVNTFNQNYPNYGPATDTKNAWTSATWGMMLTVRNMLSQLGVSNLSNRSTVEQAVKGFAGPVNLGPSKVSCPGAAATPNVCANTIFGYQIHSDNNLYELPTGKFEIPVG